MKRLSFTLFLLMAACAWTLAQQEVNNTQFMYNKLGVNPGYAGTQESPTLSLIYRNQWLGIEGSPQFQLLNFEIPLANQNIGIGANITRFTVGITESITATGMYAYRFKIRNGYVGVGISGSFRSLKNNYGDTRLVATQDRNLDQAIPLTQQQKFLFNFGSGVYYQGQIFYIGVSAPRLLSNNIDFADNDDFISREIQHFYLMGGVNFPLNDEETLALQPQFLIRYVDNAPLDADINVSLMIQQKYIAGITYRMGGSTISGIGESIDVLLSAQLSPVILFGVSYDITLSELRTYNTGSIEALLRFTFGGSNETNDLVSPRFF